MFNKIKMYRFRDEKVKDIIKHFTENPKTMFLLDSLGAMLTAFFLFVILKYFKEYVGMPQTALTYLSIIATCFFIYSTACFCFLKENWAPFIRVISIANLLYCILTMLLIIVYYPTLTAIGILYFLTEIILVCGLVYIELSVTKINSAHKQ